MSAFDQLAARLAQRPGVTNPKGLAAVIGRKKFGKATMAEAAQKRESVKTVLRKRRGGARMGASSS
jgi:hypothetical protein